MEGLVDLSLFEWNPTGNSDAHGVSSGSAEYYQPAMGLREFYGPSPNADIIREREDIQEAMRRSIHESAPQSEPRWDTAIGEESDIRETIVDASRRREVIMKPLPPLPRTRICQRVGDEGTQCILKRIKKSATDPSLPSPGSLLQRRNGITPPQLTLSVPHESPLPQNNSNRNASPMVWMPDEQMWLIVGEPEQRTASTTQPAYPTPPAYTPRASARSEPASRMNSTWDLTPPQTPIQSQLQSLLQPRDEERLSPLFQEAMNSVPMTDTFDLPPPPSYEGSVGRSALGQLRPHTSVSERYPPYNNNTSPHRASTTGSARPRVRSDTSADRSSGHGSFSSVGVSTPSSMRPGNSVRGFHSTSSSQSYRTAPEGTETPSSNSYRPLAISTRSWHGLAQRLARPKSTT